MGPLTCSKRRSPALESSVGASGTDMFQHYNPTSGATTSSVWASWSVAGDGLTSGAAESASFPTGVKEVLAMFAEGPIDHPSAGDLQGGTLATSLCTRTQPPSKQPYASPHS